MAAISRVTYKSTNNNLITTNGVGDISGADARAMFEATADSFLNNNNIYSALAEDATTWSAGYFDRVVTTISLTTTSHEITLNFTNSSGEYVLFVTKNTASDCTLTFSMENGALTINYINSNVLKGASGTIYKVTIVRVSANAYVNVGKPFKIVNDSSPQLGGELDANSNKITNLAAPTNANDAARKADIDAVTHPYNYTATTDPGANNDSNDTGASDGIGYQVGSKWLNTVSGEWFMSVSVADGGAVWEPISLSVDELNAIAVSGLTSGNCITASGTSGNLGGTATGNVFILIPDDGTKSFTIQMANDATTYSPRIVFGDDSTFEIFMSDGISESVGFSFNLNTGVLELMAASANKILFPEGENTTNGDGLINKTYADKTRPIPSALTDGAAIAFDFNSKYFDLKTLTTTTTAITLTLSNVVAGANQILSVIKNTASDVTITLAGTGLSFYGYDGADYSTTPNIVLSGATGDIFDISLLARTATSIGVAVGNNGN